MIYTHQSHCCAIICNLILLLIFDERFSSFHFCSKVKYLFIISIAFISFDDKLIVEILKN